MAGQAAGMNLVCLIGNHEDMMWSAMKGEYDPNWWLSKGGDTTLDSYNHNVPQSHLNWISSLPKLHVDRHRVYVHAGVDPTRRLHEQSHEYLPWFRYMPGTDIGHGDRHVVHGHTPSSSNPETLKNRTNLDTGAYATGRLVIAVFDDDASGGAIDYIEIR
jgi:serine/threonine protein phosphatase 1